MVHFEHLIDWLGDQMAAHNLRPPSATEIWTWSPADRDWYRWDADGRQYVSSRGGVVAGGGGHHGRIGMSLSGTPSTPLII